VSDHQENTNPKRFWNTAAGILRALAIYCVLYVGSYALNSYLGGYWSKPDRDGRHRWSSGGYMTDAFLWQPRFGYCAPGRSDWLGRIYKPLIQIDRALIHRTHYLVDAGFWEWMTTSPVSVWHPTHRAKIQAVRDEGQRAEASR
jgi:hypothetical protein